MPALPNVLNRSSSSSEDVMSAGSSSLTSSYSRYPFSLPMEMSCLTSSYFSSIDNAMSSCAPLRRSQIPEPSIREPIVCAGLPRLHQRLDLLLQQLFARPEGVDFRLVLGRPLLLEPVDFTLDRGPFTIET